MCLAQLDWGHVEAEEGMQEKQGELEKQVVEESFLELGWRTEKPEY